jgi:hypothetical protein
MKKLSILIACFIFIGTGNAFTELLPKHVLKVGPEFSYITYKEPNVMKERGLMYGVSASYSYHNKQNLLMLGIEGKASYGEVDYKGATFIGTPLEIDNIPDYMLEFRGLVGVDLPVKDFYVTYYTGIGYRYLNDDAHEKYAGGYERESNYFYSPIGMKLTAPLENDWSFRATAEADIFWKGTQKSHLEDLDIGLHKVDNDQDFNTGYGLRGSMSLQKKLNNLWIEIEPFIRYWHIKDSDTEVVKFDGFTGSIWEPSNHSTELGVMLLIAF